MAETTEPTAEAKGQGSPPDRPYSKIYTFEDVWAALMESKERQKETDLKFQETDRMFKETKQLFKETREQMQETKLLFNETEKQMKETYRKIGELGNRFGELAEHLVIPNIMEKFNELHFNFEQISQNIVIKDPSGCFLAEIDILLENGDIAIAVEVKARALHGDVDDHVSRMEVLRRRADARNDARKFQGAIAGAIMSDEVRNYILKTGFYAIEQTGDTVKINIPPGFKPREW